MQIELPEGKYVVAVSGGVDSVVLLHLLAQKKLSEELVSDTDKKSYEFIVAHFDHGIREDSESDRKFVQGLADSYGLPFVFKRVELGAGASEDTARRARYEFLHEVRVANGAKAIITAHHEDDLIETAILNLVRGTSGRGLHSLRSTDVIVRPMLHLQKQEILDYARKNKLSWHEDSTNAETVILRNYIRHNYLPKLSDVKRLEFLRLIMRAAEISREIDHITRDYLLAQSELDKLNRNSFKELPDEVAREIMAAWLRDRTEGFQVTRKMLERLVSAAKTGRNGSLIDVMKGYRFKLSRNFVELERSNS